MRTAITCRGHQRHSEADGNQLREAIQCNASRSVAISRNQSHSVALSRTQSLTAPSACSKKIVCAISRNQLQSVALSRTQSHSVAHRAQRMLKEDSVRNPEERVVIDGDTHEWRQRRSGRVQTEVVCTREKRRREHVLL
jgi:hypothetical protein